MAPFSARSCRFTALGLSAVVMVMSVDSSGMRAAGPIQVNSTAIVVNAGDGRCTLPGAIRSANMNTASGGVPSECAAGVAGLDTITLPAGTYTLTAIHATFAADMGLLAISTPIEIVGESAATTIIERSSTAPNMVIFFTTGNLTLTRATVRNARWPPRGGSAIATGSAQTTIIDCVFSGNSSDWGGAVYSHQGRVTVRGSRFEGNVARVSSRSRTASSRRTA